MTSHVLLPALDPHAPATLAAVARACCAELGFDGLLVSDALDMAGRAPGRGEAGRCGARSRGGLRPALPGR